MSSFAGADAVVPEFAMANIRDPHACPASDAGSRLCALPRSGRDDSAS